MLAEYGIDHVDVMDRWTMAQMRHIVARLTERKQREREHYENPQSGGGGAKQPGVKTVGLAEVANMARQQGKVKRLKVRQKGHGE